MQIVEESAGVEPAGWWAQFAAARASWRALGGIKVTPATRLARLAELYSAVTAMYRAYGIDNAQIRLDIPMEIEKVPADHLPRLSASVTLMMFAEVWEGVQFLRNAITSRSAPSLVEQQFAQLDQALGMATRLAWVLAAGERMHPIIEEEKR